MTALNCLSSATDRLLQPWPRRRSCCLPGFICNNTPTTPTTMTKARSSRPNRKRRLVVSATTFLFVSCGFFECHAEGAIRGRRRSTLEQRQSLSLSPLQSSPDGQVLLSFGHSEAPPVDARESNNLRYPGWKDYYDEPRPGEQNVQPIPAALARHLHQVDADDASRSSHPHHDNDDNVMVIHVENTRSFQIVFGTFLTIVFLVRSILCCLLIKYRKHGSLQLAQPSVLAALVLSGSISIMSCYFLIHNNTTKRHQTDNLFCLLRDPFIMTPLTFAGNILLARVWRIVLLLTPVLNVGRGGVSLHDSDEPLPWGDRFKGFLLQHLTRLADFYYWIDWTRRKFLAKCSGGNESYIRRTNRNTTIRNTVPLQQLFLLTFVLTLPQLALQILKLTVPSLKQQLATKETVYGNAFLEERHACSADVGYWPTILGIVLTFLPYFLTAIMAWNSADDLPKVFDEAKAYTRASKLLFLVLAICVPTFVFDGVDSPDSMVYLVTMLVFAFAMPPSWFLVYPKLWRVLTDDDEEIKTKFQIRRLLQKKRSRSSFLTSANRQDHGKSAKLALTIGKMYEEMGLAQKSIDLFDEAIAVWQCDPRRDHKEKIGGFTIDEINSFSVADLEHIVHLLIAKGRVNGTFQVSDSNGQKHAAHAWLDALEIYEKAPARAKIKDRSMLFPVFSGLFVFLKGEKIQQDAKCSFEQNLARKFVRETKLQGDPIHYTRALAMFCEVKAKLGKYRVALESFETLKEIYDPDEHSEAVSGAYGTDRSAQAFSQKALWHLQLGEEDKALEACEYVVDELLPLMDPTNVLNMCEMLLPIIYTYKPRGQEKRMNALFQKYVVNNFRLHFKDKSTPCEPVLKPMTMLLTICSDPESFPDLAGAVEWMVQEDSGVPSDFLDSIYTKLCWSLSSLTAELCLRLAKCLLETQGDLNDVDALVQKGLKLCKRTEKKLKDRSGVVILPIANALHEPVYSELKDLGDTIGIASMLKLGENTRSSFSSMVSWAVDPSGLPMSYLQAPGRSSNDSLSFDSCMSNDNIQIPPNTVTSARNESGTMSNSLSGSKHSIEVENESTSLPVALSMEFESKTEEETSTAEAEGIVVA